MATTRNSPSYPSRSIGWFQGAEQNSGHLPGALEESHAVTNIDHVVLYASDTEATVRFYGDVLGFALDGLDEWRLGTRPTFHIQISDQQFINVHPAESELHPRAACAVPGGLDICILTDLPISDIVAQFERGCVPIDVGPVARTTSLRVPSSSVYVRDPDGNLVEVMSTDPT
jgi:catechol 2,3-dioxygenase-like lactoylglutathione lyase family enzyme